MQKFVVVCWQYSRVRLYSAQECLSGVLVFMANVNQSAMMTVLARGFVYSADADADAVLTGGSPQEYVQKYIF